MMDRTRQPRSPFALAVRPAYFASDIEGETYLSTNGGTLVLGRFGERKIGITCQHVLSGYDPSQLLIKRSLRGDFDIHAHGFLYFTGDREDTAGSEIEDLLIFTWRNPQPEIPAEEMVDFDVVVESDPNDKVVAVGFPKDQIDIAQLPAKAFCLELHMIDNGKYGNDAFLRLCGGIYQEDFDIERLTGFSGGLVYNETKGGPAGIVVRGGIQGGRVRLYYVSLVRVLTALRSKLPQFEAELDEPPSAR